MGSNPIVVEGPRLPPPLPTERTCPGDYQKHKGACFKFGAHSSYAMAKTSCEAAGARLADIEQTFVKYIRDQVRTMGGNDFWIGSFTNNGRVFRQKGRTSCPLLRGQMINDAFYGLVDCNSANKYICQKYGPEKANNPLDFNPGSAFGLDPKKKPGSNVVPSTTTLATKTDSSADGGGGTSPVIYAIVTVVIIILVLVAIKLLFNRYMSNKKSVKKQPNKGVEEDKYIAKENGGKGIVFSPKWRQDPASKASSVDSAVPPSNPSPSLEKHYSEGKLHEKSVEHKKDPALDQGNHRMGRPRVNGPEPTRKPPHDNVGVIMSTRSLSRAKDDREYRRRRPRRTYSDPRSEFSHNPYARNEHYRRRRRSYYSDYSGSEFDSESDDSEYGGRRHGPRKVYQRYPSEYRTYREPQHYHFGPPRRESHYDPYGRGHYGRNRSKRNTHGNVYHNDGHRRQSRQPSHQRYASYGRTKNSHGERHRSRMPTVSGRVAQLQEKQYFPEPHRLMSWTDPGELQETQPSMEQLVHISTRSFPREPIWVNRQIHQSSKPQKHKRDKKSKNKDENHIYELLDEANRNKELKKAAKRNKNRKSTEGKHFKRDSGIRASVRSVTSIQSRRLPTPPTR